LLIVVVTLGVSYAAESPLYFAKEEVSHTHAFDEWASPFAGGYGAGWEAVRGSLVKKVGILEPVALGGILLLLLLGAGLAAFDRRGRVETWLTSAPPPSNRPKSLWNRDVPGPVLGLAALGGLVVFSVVALFIYYPAPGEAFTEIAAVHADAFVAVNTGKKDEAIRQIQRLDDLSRKLQVGVFIRTGKMDAAAGLATEDLRERLEELRDALLANSLAVAKAMLPQVEKAYRRCRSSYQSDARNE
jgi:hypothetical protein